MKLHSTIPAFPVHNIETATAFYVSKFGFRCDYKNAKIAVLHRDQIELHLWASDDRRWKLRSLLLFLKPIISGAESFLAGTHSCRVQVTEIDELFEELRAAGVLYNSSTTIQKTEWGTREFPTLDLHGNLLTFYELLRNAS